MKSPFRTKRFLAALGGVFGLLLILGRLWGEPLTQAAAAAALWTSIGAIIFVAARLYRSIRGMDGDLWADTLENMPDER